MPGASKEAKSLLQKLITFDPEVRFSAAEALRHDFFSEVVSGSRLDPLYSCCFDMEFIPTVVEYNGNNDRRGTFGIY